MLYVIAEQLGFPGILNLIRYLSFRAGAASATALLIGLLLGPWLIGWLRTKQGKGQPIRTDGPQSHLAKRGTPTMGGLLILIGEEMRPLAELVVGKISLDLVGSVDEAIAGLLAKLHPGDAVLVKASNSVGLAKLVDRVAGGVACST